MEGCSRAAKRRGELALSQAWHTEAFARQKTLKSLDKLLGLKPKAQTPDEMFAILQGIAMRGAPMNIKTVH